jgi:hypothetical protein
MTPGTGRWDLDVMTEIRRRRRHVLRIRADAQTHWGERITQLSITRQTLCGGSDLLMYSSSLLILCQFQDAVAQCRSTVGSPWIILPQPIYLTSSVRVGADTVLVDQDEQLLELFGHSPTHTSAAAIPLRESPLRPDPRHSHASSNLGLDEKWSVRETDKQKYTSKQDEARLSEPSTLQSLKLY